MFLGNLQTETEGNIDMIIENQKIGDIGKNLTKPIGFPDINFSDAIVYPGLINSHDHLDFNLFPPLGNGKYKNYIEWGTDIHLNNKEEIDKVLRIPFELRLSWGIYKNLINGITTVVNHGTEMNTKTDIITVFEKCNILHSVGFEKNWRLKLNRPIKNKYPFVIHVGEGITEDTHKEIDQLIKWNLLDREIIAVHGIAMDEYQAEKFKGLVWCPASNYFLIGETAAIDKLKNKTKLVFGTDSTLSAPWNLWDHFRAVRNKGFITENELINMLTLNPGQLWGMEGSGEIKKGKDADILILKNKINGNKIDSFYDFNPEDILMVMSKGNIRMFDTEILDQLENFKIPLENFSKITMGRSRKYVYGNLPDLIKRIKGYYPEINLPIQTENQA